MKYLCCLMILTGFALQSVSCSEQKKGNPQLVKDAQEMVKLGCECKDVNCLHNVKVNGQSYAKIRMSSGTKDLKAEERDQFNSALNEWSNCELKLTQKK